MTCSIGVIALGAEAAIAGDAMAMDASKLNLIR
jgi:hypothetical protein